MLRESNTEAVATAHLDDRHVGDIQGALGTIRVGDTGARKTPWAKFVTFLAVLGPGLIVMVGDNDAGAYGTYTQTGQNYGTALLWTLLVLVPVLYVNQEMVLRLGVVSGVGHARLILERFGKLWGAFSVIDLFILNALTILTEFIGVSLAAKYLGFPPLVGVLVPAVLVMVGASTGSFRVFERFAVILSVGSLFFIPVFIMVHPSVGAMAHDMLIPGLPHGAQLSTVLLLIIGIVGTTVAPWQLFFQQSYVIDKRITPRFMNYARWDLVVGIFVVIAGGLALMGLSAAAFAGHAEFGAFQDAGTVAAGLQKYVGRAAGVFFAVSLIVASIIGAAAISLSTAYAVGDVLSLNHSLHRKVTDAPAFYAIYAGLIAVAAVLVLLPGVPLGLLTNAVQALAGVLLPSATIFLLLLCNDAAVLGPWVNTTRVNLFTGVVIAIMVMLSVILTAAVLFPDITETQILWILGAGTTAAVGIGFWMAFGRPEGRPVLSVVDADRTNWRMPPLDSLPSGKLTPLNRFWLGSLRAYLLVAVILVIVRVTQLALHTH